MEVEYRRKKGEVSHELQLLLPIRRMPKEKKVHPGQTPIPGMQTKGLH
jgi:hypothetical protein